MSDFSIWLIHQRDGGQMRINRGLAEAIRMERFGVV